MELFSEEWAAAWRARLNDSPSHREAAATWRGRVALVMSDARLEPECAVNLETADGRCDTARPATRADLDAAEFVFQAPPAVWREGFGGSIAPATAVFTGRLRLTRGNLGQLMPYVGAARERLAPAAKLEAG